VEGNVTEERTPERSQKTQRLIAIFGAGLSAFMVLSLSTIIVLCILIVPKVRELDNRLANLESLGERLRRLEAKGGGVELSTESFKRLEKFLSSRIDEIHKGRSTPETRGAANTETNIAESTPIIAAKEEAKMRSHEVQSGETLYGIGRRYGISVDRLQRLNELGKRVTIYPTQTLMVGPTGRR
jgi:LysM repeat protein